MTADRDFCARRDVTSARLDVKRKGARFRGVAVPPPSGQGKHWVQIAADERDGAGGFMLSEQEAHGVLLKAM